ncbi:hypothetical protein BJY04DRAFT_45820 [Aspergillus karnatakaensis]|uniref:zinc knuckle domain protein n=1 Tax=Aspergillus karnatakaensis TaxID=1810916 RepID=UPI003CCE1B43
MSDISNDDQDSRIASLGAQRARGTASASGSNRSSRHTSREPPSKRQRRSRNTQDTDVQDFVPRGASFSATTLEVDPVNTAGSDDETSSESSSGSDSLSESESESDSQNESESESEDKDETAKGVTSIVGTTSAPAPNWNKTGKSVIRTSLRGASSANANANATASTGPESAAAKNFEAVNGTYWRGRSASGSPTRAEDQDKEEANDFNDVEMEEGEVHEESQSIASAESDDSESLDSEADDSIILNVGSEGQSRSQNDVITISDEDSSGDDAYDPESLSVSRTPATIDIFEGQDGAMNGSATDSKESALLRFAQKYPAAPLTLADLDQDDMDLQAKMVFYDRDVNDINLQMPITCLECLREGHLADVCPLKECAHCGAWNRHQSSLCPQWRRCQRCRERGHDQKQCPSALKNTATEIPCDLCGSTTHIETECDYLWRFPRQDTTASPAIVSISCCHCTSNSHLVGDCPNLNRHFPFSSFTTRGIDPGVITNLNSVLNASHGRAPPPTGGQRGLKIRGRADQARSPSPESDDMMLMSRSDDRRGGPINGNRNANRGNINIRIGGMAGKNNRGPNGPPPPPSRDYRDREDSYTRSYDPRQRSMSPGRDRGRPGRGRGGWQQQPPPPRSPPRHGRPSGPPRGGRGGGNGRGGRGGKRGGGGDAYRPMPSAGKKAWDRYRL